jgi:hypothetical protein
MKTITVNRFLYNLFIELDLDRTYCYYLQFKYLHRNSLLLDNNISHLSRETGYCRKMIREHLRDMLKHGFIKRDGSHILFVSHNELWDHYALDKGGIRQYEQQFLKTEERKKIHHKILVPEKANYQDMKCSLDVYLLQFSHKKQEYARIDLNGNIQKCLKKIADDDMCGISTSKKVDKVHEKIDNLKLIRGNGYTSGTIQKSSYALPYNANGINWFMNTFVVKKSTASYIKQQMIKRGYISCNRMVIKTKLKEMPPQKKYDRQYMSHFVSVLRRAGMVCWYSMNEEAIFERHPDEIIIKKPVLKNDRKSLGFESHMAGEKKKKSQLYYKYNITS